MKQMILIPTDFSTNAQNAVNYALSLFDDDNQVKIILMHSYRILPVGAGEYITDLHDFEAQSDEGLKQVLKTIDKTFPGRNPDIEVVSKLGYPVSVMEALVKEKNVDMVVMGTKGAGVIKEVLIGSITADAIKTLDCPVLAVPENCRFKIPEAIAFAADFENIEEEVLLDPMVEIAGKFNSKIFIVHVEKEGGIVNVQQAMQGLRLHDYFGKIPHFFEEVKDSNPAEGLEKYINTRAVDMLVTIARKHGFMESLFKPSITGKLAMHTNIPLLALQHKKIS